LKEIVQIYCGEHMSFAVDQAGDVRAWGLNKNNCLLVNQPEIGIVKTIVEEPMLV
jgi:alpha-tubulin suppressor-like RCC1 family protein